MSASPELSTRLQMRWGDTDIYGHVNNVVWLRYLEEARIRLFGLPDLPSTADPLHAPVFAGLDPGCFTITAGQRIEYVAELPYHGQVVVAVGWISRIGSSSLELSFRVTDESGESVYLLATTTQAVRDTSTRTAHRFSDRELAMLSEHLGAPVEFR